jgi:hypothetical protein
MLLTVDAAFAIKRHRWTIRPRCSTVILASGDRLRIELSFVRKPTRHYFNFVLSTDRLASGEMKACKELQNFRKALRPAHCPTSSAAYQRLFRETNDGQLRPP